jgi:hypothetical protein
LRGASAGGLTAAASGRDAADDRAVRDAADDRAVRDDTDYNRRRACARLP